MATDTVEHHNGTAVLVCQPDGPILADGRAATDLIGAAFGHAAEVVLVPASRLPATFFDLSSGLAGEIVQKFVNYRLRLAVVGDISEHLDASSALRAFVAESNRGRQLWFLDSPQELDERLGH